MRRFLSLALVLVLCLSMAACGKKTEDSLSDGVLTVAMECAYAPYNWTQPTDANGAVKIKDSNDYAYGYDVMMAKKIAAALNAELEIVKLDWDSLVPAVQSGVVDCVIAGQSITSERKQMVDFSEPYYEVRQAVVTPKGMTLKTLADMNGKTLGAQIGTTGFMAITKAPGVKAKSFDEIGMAMEALAAGRLDGVVCDDPTATNYILANKDYAEKMHVAVVLPADVPEYYGFAVDKGNTKVVELLNKGIAAVKAKGIDKELRKKWIGAE